MNFYRSKIVFRVLNAFLRSLNIVRYLLIFVIPSAVRVALQTSSNKDNDALAIARELLRWLYIWWLLYK